MSKVREKKCACAFPTRYQLIPLTLSELLRACNMAYKTYYEVISWLITRNSLFINRTSHALRLEKEVAAISYARTRKSKGDILGIFKS